jgi:hypothetical protein
MKTTDINKYIYELLKKGPHISSEKQLHEMHVIILVHSI